MQAPGCPGPADEIDRLPAAEQAQAVWAMQRARHASPIRDTFCGQLRSTVTCSTCSRPSHCFEPFLDLSLPIPTLESGRKVRLQDCMAAFMEEERLEEENAVRISQICWLAYSFMPAKDDDSALLLAFFSSCFSSFSVSLQQLLLSSTSTEETECLSLPPCAGPPPQGKPLGPRKCYWITEWLDKKNDPI